jgi:transcriptional regulator with XRE-family HTH domain
MTTSGQMELLSEILEWKPIPQDTLVYFRERLRHRLHSAILDAFTRRAKERGLKQKDLASRIHRSHVQINRWLSTATNLTLDSISDLMVGLGMDFDAFPFTPIEKTFAVTERQETGEKSSDIPKIGVIDMGSTTSKLDEIGLLGTFKRILLEEIPLGSGASTPVPTMSNAGAVVDPTKTIRNQAHGGNIIPMDDYKPRALGQSDGENDFAKMGEW